MKHNICLSAMSPSGLCFVEPNMFNDPSVGHHDTILTDFGVDSLPVLLQRLCPVTPDYGALLQKPLPSDPVNKCLLGTTFLFHPLVIPQAGFVGTINSS